MLPGGAVLYSSPQAGPGTRKLKQKTPGSSRDPGALACSGGEARSPDLTIMSRKVFRYCCRRLPHLVAIL